MRALIHIGLPKTGSSSIQEFLRLNRPALCARGIRHAPLDPRFGSQFELGALGLDAAGAVIEAEMARRVLNLRDDAQARDYAARARAFLDAGVAAWTEPLYVGSSEHLAAWIDRPERVRALDGALSARFDEVRYLVYLRPQVELLLSGYSERVLRGGTETLEAHLDKRRGVHDHDRLVRRWEQAVGAERLEVRLLRADFLQDGDLVRDFCAVLGTPPEGLAMPPRVRPSLSAGDIRFRRRLNRFLRLREQGGGDNPRYLVALRLGRLLGLRGGPQLRLTEAQRARIEADYADSNEALRVRRFPQRARLF